MSDRIAVTDFYFQLIVFSTENQILWQYCSGDAVYFIFCPWATLHDNITQCNTKLFTMYDVVSLHQMMMQNWATALVFLKAIMLTRKPTT